MQVTDETITQLKDLGAPDDVIEAAQAKVTTPDDACHVWEENWRSLEFFLGIEHQWVIVSGMAGVHYVGLNYPAIESVMRTLSPVPKKQRPALFNDLRVMERAALEILNSPKD